MFSHKLAQIKYFNNFQRCFGLRIGGASAFWGDTSVAIPQLIYNGKINFLIMDYLSEITMSLLVRARSLDATKGYTPDILSIAKYSRELKNQGIRVIANAGGINPEGCSEELKRLFRKADVDLNVAIVTGDDLMRDKTLVGHLEKFNDVALPKETFFSSNAYFGSSPIQLALDKGADIVITGRCVDSALVLGPLMHHFKWRSKDLDKLAAGSLAGHLIECGAQVTGGIFTDCFTVPDWWNIGFPIADVEESGLFTITKPGHTGGLVNTATVSEQLVYEIGDPSFYVLPDVICDFTNVTMKETFKNSVEVQGAKGLSPSNYFKVSSTYLDKHRLTAVATIIGKDAVAKGRATAEQIIFRVQNILKKLNIADFSRINIQVIGGEDCYGPWKNEKIIKNVREAVIWISVEHNEVKALQILAKEVAPAGTGMAPGLTTLVGGRPKISPIFKLHSSLIRKDKVNALIKMNDEDINLPFEMNKNSINYKKPNLKTGPKHSENTYKVQYKLHDLAYARSGDKGDSCNIGVIARDDRAWSIIKERLSIDVVGKYFSHLFNDNTYIGNIERFELPGIKALNFILNNSLGGGGVSSLRIDPQGKAYGQMLLDITI